YNRDRHPWRPECALARRVAVNQSSFAIDILAGESRELFGQTEVRQKLPGARMHSVTAEVAHEVGMLFQYLHRHPRTGEQQTEHHAGRSAADDHACRRIL